MESLRHRFPSISDTWARFDGPAGTQAVGTAIDAMAAYLRSGDSANAQGAFAASAATDSLMGEGRGAVADLLDADPDGVVFGPNMTTLTFAFTRAVARRLGPGDEIVCTRLDHDANVTPWVLAAADAGATVRFAQIDERSGRLSVDSVEAELTEHTRWVAVTGASNAIGTMPDIAAICASARSAGAATFVDGVHLVPHRAVSVRSVGCDVLVTSPYKWYGPHAGVMVADADLLAGLEPYKVRPAPDRGPSRWESGTTSYEAVAGVVAAARFLLDVGMDEIERRERAVFQPLLDGLLGMDHVTVHGPRDMTDRAPTVAFTVAGVAPRVVAERLAAERIAVWSGNYYAVEVMEALGLPLGAVRAGVACYTAPADVERLIDAVARLA